MINMFLYVEATNLLSPISAAMRPPRAQAPAAALPAAQLYLSRDQQQYLTNHKLVLVELGEPGQTITYVAMCLGDHRMSLERGSDYYRNVWGLIENADLRRPEFELTDHGEYSMARPNIDRDFFQQHYARVNAGQEPFKYRLIRLDTLLQAAYDIDTGFYRKITAPSRMGGPEGALYTQMFEIDINRDPSPQTLQISPEVVSLIRQIFDTRYTTSKLSIISNAAAINPLLHAMFP